MCHQRSPVGTTSNVTYYQSGAAACADLELRVSAQAEGEWLTSLEDIFVVEPVGHGSRMHTIILLESCFIHREVWEYYIESGTLEIDSSEPIYRYDPASHTRTQLGNGVACWDKNDDLVVVCYQSGRIECRLIANLPEVWRVGYHTSAPTSVKIIDYGDRRFVAVAAGDVWWFEIPKVATRF